MNGERKHCQWNSSQSELRLSLLGKLITRLYRRLPARNRLLRMVTRHEGSEFRSASLRAILERHHGVSIGAHSYGSLLWPGAADPGTTIGRYVSIGPSVRRFGAAHPAERLTMHPYWYNPSLGMVDKSMDVARTSVSIESEVWIGANAIILPGCTRIGYGAIIGAGAVVTRDVADFAIVVGSPARQVGLRLDAHVREQLLDARPWDLAPERADAVRAAILARQIT